MDFSLGKSLDQISHDPNGILGNLEWLGQPQEFIMNPTQNISDPFSFLKQQNFDKLNEILQFQYLVLSFEVITFISEMIHE